jgi:transposase
MERSPFLPLPEGMVIGQVEITPTQLTVEVISTQPCACCPGCGNLSDSVHCQYQRTVHDVPCGGRRVVLRLCVRKFFCRMPACHRKVFAERLPDLVQPWARVSNRLLEELQALGLAASAEVNERLAPRLGMRVKAPTLLRYLRAIPPPDDAPVRVLGIDDFAMRRGDCYGTILVNLQTHRPVDLLPDRTAEAVLPWLKRHREIDVVSRDRASSYADAVNRALPHATQVADRYHLVQNLREHLQRLLDRRRTCLPLVEDTSLPAAQAGTTDSLGIPCELPPGESLVATPERAKAEEPDQPFHMAQPEQPVSLMEQEAELSSLTSAERKKKISRDKRYARYEEVMALHRAGIGLRAIARQLRISRKVVRRFVAAPCFPERAEGTGQHHKKKSKVAPYLPYLRERWASGAHNGLQLFREIKDRGYTGSRALLGRLIAQWRTELPPKPGQGKPRKPRMVAKSGQRRLSSRSASFLMILPPEKLTVVQRQQLEHLCQASSDLHTVYLFSQEFVTMLKERQAESLHGWLKRVKESHVAELTSFANGISRDYAAVYAACSRSESNGITEGHVNRLKFLKRQMFGRAHLDLLRVKVLHAV